MFQYLRKIQDQINQTFVQDSCPKNHKNSHSQSGRSLTEMLGVLVVIGVLSIAAVLGFEYAIAKYKTNTLMKDLDMRSLTLSAQITQMTPPLIAGLALTTDASPTTPLGQSVTQFISVNNPDYFEIEVQPIPQNVCKQLLKDYPSASLMFVNDMSFKGDIALCKEGDNVMNFVYPKDLGGRPLCSDKGFFDDSSYTCKCSGNTYFNPVTNDCSCPAGHVWSAGERICVESICGEGYFETAAEGCVSCDDPISYLVPRDVTHQMLCEACPNRYIAKNYFHCALKICEEGVSYPSERGEKCFSCADTKIWEYTDRNDYAQTLCNSCSNRHFVDVPGTQCQLNNPCEEGKAYYGRDQLTGAGACRSCQDITRYRVDEYDAVQCLACVNASGQKNRALTGNNICSQIICESGEFKGADGACYACSEARTITVTEGSGCENVTCGREIINGKCQKKCPEGTHVKAPNGDCFSCDDRTFFKLSQSECEQACPQRRWLSNGWCALNTCKKGVNYPWAGNSILCYPCAGWQDGSGSTGTSEWSKEYCEACGNYLAGNHCYRKDSCKRGEQFRTNNTINYKFCRACDLNTKELLENHPEHRKMCADCATTKRFYANNYCYRCDSGEAPTVTTTEEQNSCMACGIREVVGNICRLKQSQ